MTKPVLYSYWRSSCSWRVRAALAYKGIDYEYKAVNLLKSEQTSADYLAVNPSGKVPSLVIDGETLNESLSILEYLEESRKDTPSILPKDLLERAKVRRIALEITSGIQPIQNFKILKHIGEVFGNEHKSEWGHHFITEGFVVVEKLLKESAGEYCVGNQLSIADFCLVPQIYNAKRFNVKMENFPTIDRVGATLLELECFQKSHPSRQPDTPEADRNTTPVV